MLTYKMPCGVTIAFVIFITNKSYKNIAAHWRMFNGFSILLLVHLDTYCVILYSQHLHEVVNPSQPFIWHELF